MSPDAAESPRNRIGGSAHLIAVALLAIDVLAVHGWSLGDGRVLDDHWHARQFERGGWSWGELIDATTIEPVRFMHAWWQDKTVRWEYFRPASVALMKAVHQLTGGAPAAQHAVSITLHLANTLLVYLLCWMLTRHVLWSAAGGLIFAAYSHSIITVAWLAAQNAVLQTGLTLAAMLCYARASGLSLYSLPRAHDPAEKGGAVAGGQVAGDEGPPAALRKNWLLATVLLWALALLSRENAVVLPVILVVIDLAFGGWRHLRRRWWIHLPLFAIAGAFTVWRVLAFEPMPDVYFRRPDGPGYAGWLAVKLLHYICAAVWHSPMTIGPSGRYDPIAEVPLDNLLMLGIVGFMSLGYAAAARRTRGRWIWPLWLLLAVAPATPIMATPHTGYMPAVGAAAAIALAAAAQTSHRGRRGHRGEEQGEWRQGRIVGIWRSFGRLSPAAAVFFVIAVHGYAPIYRALWLSFPAAERVLVEALVASEPPPKPGTHLFFINLPFANIYLGPKLEERWPESAPIHCHVLTYAPDVLKATGPFRVVHHGQQLETQFLGNPGWFSGFLGRFLLDGMRVGGRPGLTEPVRGGLFDVKSWYSNGLRNLRFTFHHPVHRDDYRFYVCSESGPVHRLDWSGMERYPAIVGPGGPLDLGERRGQVDFRVGSHPVDALDTGRISELLFQRDALQRIRDRAAMIIRTDLYLTGPPYPGPK